MTPVDVQMPMWPMIGKNHLWEKRTWKGRAQGSLSAGEAELGHSIRLEQMSIIHVPMRVV